MIAFNIANQDTGELFSTISELNTIEKDWFERNNKLCKELKKNNGYEELSLVVENQLMKKNREIRFEFYDTDNRELLIEYAKSEFKLKFQ